MRKTDAFLIVPARKAVTATIVAVVLAAWIKQDALKNYWAQTYQSAAVWDRLASAPLWKAGAIDWDNRPLQNTLKDANDRANAALNAAFYADELARRAHEKEQALIALKKQQEQARLEELARLAPKPLTAVRIGRAQKVFFVGDSLMQGVAPWAMQRLKNERDVHSINLSKQSTGLSYDKFLNWPLTAEETFAQNPDIGLMVVFLGPNDPWAVPDPNGGAYVAFDTPRWRELYHAKMQRLLDAAQSRGSQVIWVLPPNAKRPALHQQMIALRAVMQSGLDPTKVLILNAQSLLGESEDGYSDSLTLDGKVVKMRTADGVHFTSDGQKRVADAIFAAIEVL